jgi:lactoylglutathione lyase
MTRPVTFRDAFPIYAAENMAKSLAFYRDLLGFTVTYRWPEEGEPAFVSLDLGASHLGLGGRQARHPYTGTTYATGGTPPIELCIYVDDLDRAIAYLAEHDVPVLLQPTAQPWGERIAYVADPDGNHVLVIEPIES